MRLLLFTYLLISLEKKKQSVLLKINKKDEMNTTQSCNN